MRLKELCCVLMTAYLPLAGGAVLADERGSEFVAAPADVDSIDAIMAAVYDVISGDAGVPRDWDRMRSLFHEDARLIAVGADGGTRVMSVEDYIETGGPFLLQGFHEREIFRKQERFGNVVHAWSTYEGRRTLDEAPMLRGVNSFQLLYRDGRWWIVTIFWQAESEDLPLPDEYLP